MSPTARRPAWAARLRVASCAAVAAVLALGAAAPVAAAGSATAVGYAPHPPVPGLRVVLDDVQPTVPRIGEEVVLRGRVVNGSATQQRIGHVSVEAAWSPITTRPGVADWFAGPAGTGTEWLLGVDAVGPVVAAGSQVPFTVTVPDNALVGLDGDRTVLGLEIHAHPEEDGRPGLVDEAPATLRTVLVADRGAEVAVPLGTSWVVPLTLPADPDLTTTDDARWQAAWVGATGEGSAVRTWLDGFTLPGVTWLVDPALLVPHRLEALSAPEEVPGGEPTGEPTDGPGETSTEAPTTDEVTTTDGAPGTAAPTTSGPVPVPPPDDAAVETGRPEEVPSTEAPGDPEAPTDEPAASLAPEEQVEAGVVAIRERLADLDDDQLWWLPAHDPDLAAVLAGTRDETLLTRLVRRRPDAPEETRELLARGRSLVAWPLLAGASAADLSRLAAAWEAAGAGPPTVVLPRESVAGSSEAPVTRGALPLSDPSALPVLAPDSRASGLLAATGEEAALDGTGTAVQHLLADSLTAWAQDPSTARSMVVTPPRGTTLPAPVLAGLGEGVDAAPWLAPVAAETLLTDAAAAAPAALTGAGPEPEVLGGLTAYLEAGQSPLDADGLRSLSRLRRQLGGLRQVLSGPTAVSSWEDALDGAWSTRWRGETEGWLASWRPVAAAGDEARAALHVNPGTVNFLADEGLMRVTIVNTLPVPVENVRVRLVSSSNVLQVVDQPEPIAIGADSRATVTFSARAITRGETTVTAELAAPNGTTLGDDAAVDVRVQPTGVWIYWVLGAIAGVVLVLGLGRALRSTPRAVLAGTQGPERQQRPRRDRPTPTTSEPA